MQFKVFYFHQYIYGEEITGMVFVFLRRLYVLFFNAVCATALEKIKSHYS